MKNIYSLFLFVLSFFLFENSFSQWQQSSEGLQMNGTVLSMTKNENNLFVGTNGGGVYKSVNYGASWVFSGNGFESNEPYGYYNYYINSLFSYNSVVYAGTYNGVFRSYDNGYLWQQCGDLTSGYFSSFCLHSGNVYVVNTPYFYKTTNSGLNWNYCGYLSGSRYIVSDNNNLYCGCLGSGIYKSTNNGVNWSSINNGIPTSGRIRALSVINNEIYASIDTSSYPLGIFKSSNSGNNWININNGLQDLRVRCFSFTGNEIYAGTISGPYKSTNNGLSWLPVTNGANFSVFSILQHSSGVFAGGAGGVYYTSNGGTQWSQINNGFYNIYVYDLCSSNNEMFCASSQMYKSTDGGNNWFLSNSGLYSTIICLLSSGNNLFAGSFGNGVFISTNNGNNWYQSNNGLPDSMFVNSFCSHNGYIFASADYQYYFPRGVFRSSNNGVNWEQTSLNDKKINTFYSSGNKLFAGSDSGLYITTNNGINWSFAIYVSVSAIAENNNLIFIGTYGYGIMMSPDGGFSWAPLLTGPPNQYINSLLSLNNCIIAGTTSGIYVSSNSGVSWVSKNQGLFFQNVKKLFVYDNFIYAATTANGIYKRNKSEVIQVKKISESVPSTYELYQNYPNPFNPVTKIKYQVPKESFVNLRIFDISGKQLSCLESEIHKPGIYETEFNGDGFSSGFYFCTMKADNYTKTIKLLFLK